MARAAAPQSGIHAQIRPDIPWVGCDRCRSRRRHTRPASSQRHLLPSCRQSVKSTVSQPSRDANTEDFGTWGLVRRRTETKRGKARHKRSRRTRSAGATNRDPNTTLRKGGIGAPTRAAGPIPSPAHARKGRATRRPLSNRSVPSLSHNLVACSATRPGPSRPPAAFSRPRTDAATPAARAGRGWPERPRHPALQARSISNRSACPCRPARAPAGSCSGPAHPSPGSSRWLHDAPQNRPGWPWRRPPPDAAIPLTQWNDRGFDVFGVEGLKTPTSCVIRLPDMSKTRSRYDERASRSRYRPVRSSRGSSDSRAREPCVRLARHRISDER